MTNDKKPFTVLVEGNIGCGKTTLLNHFTPYAKICKEPVNLWQNVNGHNLLQLFYEDPKQWGALFQSYVMLTSIKNHLSTSSEQVKIIERSLFSSQYCFAYNLYQTGKLHKTEYQILGDWLNFLTSSLELKVDLIIYLKTQPEIVLERIKSRARKEENNISLSYLQSIHECYEDWLLYNKFPVPSCVIVLDANKSLAEMKMEYLKYQDIILGKDKFTF